MGTLTAFSSPSSPSSPSHITRVLALLNRCSRKGAKRKVQAHLNPPLAQGNGVGQGRMGKINQVGAESIMIKQ